MKIINFSLFAMQAVFADYAFAQDIAPPKQYTMTPPGVNVSDGTYVLSGTDVAMGPLQLERTHLSGFRDPQTPYHGIHMDNNFHIFVVRTGATICSDDKTCTLHYSTVVHLGLKASGVYWQNTMSDKSISANQPAPDNDDANQTSLSYDKPSDTYVYTDRDGTIYNLAGSVTSIKYPDGRIQNFTYSGGHLSMVADSSGYAMVFSYNSGGYVSYACAYNLSQTYVSASTACNASSVVKSSYIYSGNHLIQVQRPISGSEFYTYSGDEISCFSQVSVTASCETRNYYAGPEPWMVTRQELSTGAVWNYTYHGNYATDRWTVSPVQRTSTDITDGSGVSNSYSFSNSSPSSSVVGGHTTSFDFEGAPTYDAINDDPVDNTGWGSMLVSSTMPEGNRYVAEYGGPYFSLTKETSSAKPGSGVPDVAVQYGYSCPSTLTGACTRPIWKRDANGNQTDFSYMNTGQVLSEMGPAVAGGTRPLTLHTYVQKYAYLLNASGSLVPAATPIWMPSTETVCQTVPASNAASCDSNALITTTVLEYGADGTANNLLLRGKAVSSGGVTTRTCYGYDAAGNKIWEAAPRAGMAACT